MRNHRNFRSWVVAAIASWAVVAGAFVISDSDDTHSTTPRSVAAAFPTAEAGFALRAAPSDI